jgi:hypothetical protein
VHTIHKKQHLKLKLLALFQTFLLLIIVGSGMLFAHKHQLPSGEVVVHIHPYNLKKDPLGQKHQHSTNELHFLDVVFQGTYLGNDRMEVGSPWVQELHSSPLANGLPAFVTTPFIQDFYLRGPPSHLS